jgi:hypothetical protein
MPRSSKISLLALADPLDSALASLALLGLGRLSRRRHACTSAC